MAETARRAWNSIGELIQSSDELRCGDWIRGIGDVVSYQQRHNVVAICKAVKAEVERLKAENIAGRHPEGFPEVVCKQCHMNRDSVKKQQTHCIHGHEFTSENTIIKTNGTRQCRQCFRNYDRKRRDAAWWREYRRKRKEGCAGGK